MQSVTSVALFVWIDFGNSKTMIDGEVFNSIKRQVFWILDAQYFSKNIK